MANVAQRSALLNTHIVQRSIFRIYIFGNRFLAALLLITREGVEHDGDGQREHEDAGHGRHARHQLAGHRVRVNVLAVPRKKEERRKGILVCF